MHRIIISLTNENKNSKDHYKDSDNLEEPHDSDDDVIVGGDLFLGITKTIMYAAIIHMIIMEFVIPLTLNLIINLKPILRILL